MLSDLICLHMNSKRKLESTPNMSLRTLKLFLIGLFSLVTSSVLVSAASFSTDFNSGQPAGTTLSGTGPASIKPDGGVGNSGRLELVYPIPAVGISGGFGIPDFAGGVAVTNFRAKFKLLIGNGTDRPADGFSFSFGNGIVSQAPGEEGAGSGVIVSFDTWDNNADDTAPAIEVKWNGAAVAFQSMDGIREGGRPPAGPVLPNGAGGLVSLETTPPASAGIPPTNYVDVSIDLFSDNTVSVSFSNVVVFNHLAIPYSPISGGDWVLSARTGGANDDIWVDNLDIVANYVSGPVSVVDNPQNQTVTESQTASFSASAN